MHKFFYHTVAVVEEFTNLQLKAYYISSVDKNLKKVVDVHELELASSILFNFPEWLMPACSIIAAFYVLAKSFKGIWVHFKTNKKNET